MVLSASPFHQSIQDAVDVAAAKDEGRENMNYSVSDGYYPDEWVHEIILSGVPDDWVHGASVSVISELAKRGLAVNSVRVDPIRLHVVRFGWFKERADTGVADA